MKANFNHSLYVAVMRRSGTSSTWVKFNDEKHVDNYARKLFRESQDIRRITIYDQQPWNCGSILFTFLNPKP